MDSPDPKPPVFDDSSELSDAGTVVAPAEGSGRPGAVEAGRSEDRRSEPIRRRDPLVGAVLGRQYRLERAIGRGGSGRVYVANQLSLGRLVAVKTLRPDIDFEANGEQFSERFFREASMAGGLSHPNIVTVHDYGQDEDGTCFIVMELVEGSSLKDLMRTGPLDPERALDLFCQIARGLRHAHRAGLVHRDVKPGNVQLTPGDDGREVAKLLDFGLVKSDLPEVTEITREGSFLGTPHYASPEQVRGQEADARSDLYALGVMLYRALCGRLPYYSRNAMAMAMSHIKDEYPAMEERSPEVTVDPAHEAIVRRLMEKEPQDRYPDAASLLLDLESELVRLKTGAPPSESVPALTATLASEGGAAVLSAAPTALPERVAPDAADVPSSERPPQEKRGAMWLGVAAGVLLFLGGGGWMASSLGGEADEIALVGTVEDTSSAGTPTTGEADWSADALEGAVPLSLQVALASEPSGAAVMVEGQALGTTPWVGTLDLDDGTHAPLVLELSGYEAQHVVLELGDGTASATVSLRKRPPAARPAAKERAGKSEKPAGKSEKPPPEPSRARAAAAAEAARTASTGSATSTYDGVSFTAAQARATLRFANEADKGAFQAAGIRTQEFNKVAAGRPYSTLQTVAASPGVGPKTVQRMRDAAK